MNRTRRPLAPVIVALTLTVSLVACQTAREPAAPAAAGGQAEKPQSVVRNEVDTTATVTAVDPVARTVTLQGEGGRSVTLKVGEDVQGFDDLQVGDTVRARYIEAVAIAVHGPGGEPSATESQIQMRSGAGQSGGVAEIQQITANVEAIDYDNRTVTLRGPEGRTVTLKVDPRVERLQNVKVGDQVVVRHTQALGLSLEK